MKNVSHMQISWIHYWSSPRPVEKLVHHGSHQFHYISNEERAQLTSFVTHNTYFYPKIYINNFLYTPTHHGYCPWALAKQDPSRVSFHKLNASVPNPTQPMLLQTLLISVQQSRRLIWSRPFFYLCPQQ